jgi:hypothetical protein
LSTSPTNFRTPKRKVVSRENLRPDHLRWAQTMGSQSVAADP